MCARLLQANNQVQARIQQQQTANNPQTRSVSVLPNHLPALQAAMLVAHKQAVSCSSAARRTATSPLLATVPSASCVHAVMPASTRHRRPTTITAGLKKETKKLTKTLKAHRKRLESLLAVRQPATADASLAPQPQALLSQAELHAVLAEIAQLQTSLAAVRQQQRALAAAAATCDSGDSDSDCEDERPMQRRGAATATATAVQPMMLPTQQKQQQQPASSSVVCLQSPLMDQEQPDLCRQLPPPTPHTTSGRVLVCQGKACVRKGALQVLQAVSHATAASPGVEVLPCKCLGKCKQGPAMRVRTEGQPRSSLVTEIEALEVPDILDSLLAAAVAAADV